MIRHAVSRSPIQTQLPTRRGPFELEHTSAVCASAFAISIFNTNPLAVLIGWNPWIWTLPRSSSHRAPYIAPPVNGDRFSSHQSSVSLEFGRGDSTISSSILALTAPAVQSPPITFTVKHHGYQQRTPLVLELTIPHAAAETVQRDFSVGQNYRSCLN